jgi:hypothetical protein
VFHQVFIYLFFTSPYIIILRKFCLISRFRENQTGTDKPSVPSFISYKVCDSSCTSRYLLTSTSRGNIYIFLPFFSQLFLFISLFSPVRISFSLCKQSGGGGSSGGGSISAPTYSQPASTPRY